MILTPEEALKLQCCQRQSQCISYSCMAWREHFVSVPVERPTDRAYRISPVPHRLEPTGKGYCGLVYPAGG